MTSFWRSLSPWKSNLAVAAGTTQTVGAVPTVSKDDSCSRRELKEFRVPTALRTTPTGLRRILVIGSCLVEDLVSDSDRPEATQGDFVLFNNIGLLPDTPPRPIVDYDVQIVQIPLRTLLADAHFAKLKYHRADDYRFVFDQAVQRLSLALDAAMKWNHQFGITTLVVNYFRPQQDVLGRLLPRNDLRNFTYFIDRLNENLAELVGSYANSHILDFDAISATIGRIHVQDEHLWMLNHNSTLSDFDAAHDRTRLHPPLPIGQQSDLRIDAFFDAVHAEIEAMVRTLRQIDAVKLVIVDLDDTLWRGVIAEEAAEAKTNEGWPFGLAEALAVLKARGIVLAIASKNDEATIRAVWDSQLGDRLELADFVVVMIGWNPKVENVAAILRQVNVLPSSTVFIDDNPVERAAIEAAFPGIRTLGADLYGIRRTLLWSSETQVPFISDESGRRTEMIRAQVVREETRKTVSRTEFLNNLNIRVASDVITTIGHGRFPRTLELINKTNQFNTTGHRWTSEAMQAALQEGAVIHAFSVADRFTDYGLVGAVLVRGAAIEQLVMSCRVVGLDIERRMLAGIIDELKRDGSTRVSACFLATDRNAPCADVFANSGFRAEGEGWVFDLD
ncbi:HAD-IIIC family phosphatase [Methylobacterium sp. WL122]|nr:HAD-IIIC family phosphatase [Methylobacterium sp. WL122]